MPKDYERDKRRCLATGKPLKACKTEAAKKTNARRKRQGRPPAKFHRKKKR